MRRWLLIVVVSLLTASCTLGPNYRRPAVAIPSTYRDTTSAAAQAEPASLADVQWFDLFRDDTLTRIVNTALAQNFDLRIAAERVLQARERFRIVHADEFPVVTGDCSSKVRTPPRPTLVGALGSFFWIAINSAPNCRLWVRMIFVTVSR